MSALKVTFQRRGGGSSDRSDPSLATGLEPLAERMATINISAVKSCYGNSVITLSFESAEDLTAVADEASAQWTSGGTRPAISSRCRRR